MRCLPPVARLRTAVTLQHVDESGPETTQTAKRQAALSCTCAFSSDRAFCICMRLPSASGSACGCHRTARRSLRRCPCCACCCAPTSTCTSCTRQSLTSSLSSHCAPAPPSSRRHSRRLLPPHAGAGLAGRFVATNSFLALNVVRAVIVNTYCAVGSLSRWTARRRKLVHSKPSRLSAP